MNSNNGEMDTCHVAQVLLAQCILDSAENMLAFEECAFVLESS